MIKKVIKIEPKSQADDSVNLSWFDMQKPNLSAVSKEEVSFMMKVKFTHLHENDVLVCDDGHRIQVKRSEDEIYECEFSEHISFATTAYEIGNRHQPICIQDYKITILDDISLADIIKDLGKDESVTVTKTRGYFKPNGKAHHSH